MQNGLTQEDAKQRILLHGYNEIDRQGERHFLRIIADVIREPMFLLLLACTVMYLLLGELREGLTIASSIILIVSISIYQNRRTEKALRALQELAAPQATVIRDGRQMKIPGREVVPGDIIMISEGDRIPADAVLLSSRNLNIDESLLTGESVPVCKEDTLPGDAGNERTTQLVYGGTMAVRGKATAQVTVTGNNSRIGKIGRSIENIKKEKTDLQNEVDKFIRRISVLGVILCIVITILYAITRGNLLNSILSGIALSIALIPEEFPVVYAIFMAMGSWRIAKKNVVARTSSSIEALGTVTTLCVDKTGTITQNKMAVSCLSTGTDIVDTSNTYHAAIPEEYHEIIEYAILASQTRPVDPMEKAILELGMTALKDTSHIHTGRKVAREYPLSPGLMAMSRVYSSDHVYQVAAKGAPEAITDLCHMDAQRQNEIISAVHKMAAMGFRVIAVARSTCKQGILPEIQHDFDFSFCGLIGLADPVRAEIPAAIRQCYTAGIRVVIITGDYPVTAQSIARQIGLNNCDKVLAGDELAAMSPSDLREKIKDINIFARITPEQKLLIIDTLKSGGEIVAMTGDGINDAPALKSAHVGIAMGMRGTDVAKESASLILLDDNFSSIVTAIALGRRIYDNIQKAWSYVLSMHIPIIGLSLVPIFAYKLPMTLMPAHIVFMELIIDPVSSVVFENEPADVHIMERKPRSSRHRFFSKKRVVTSIVNGLLMLAAVLTVYFLALKAALSDDQVRVLTFTSLILSNLLLALSNLSAGSILATVKHPGTSVKVIFGITLLALAMVIFLPFFKNIFHFQLVRPIFFIIPAAASLLSIVWFETMKAKMAKKKLTS